MSARSSLHTRDSSYPNDVLGAGRVAQWIKVLTPQAWRPKSNPTNRKVDGENWCYKVAISPLHTCCGMWTCMHTSCTHVNNNENDKIVYVSESHISKLTLCAVHCFESWQMHSTMSPPWWYEVDDCADLTNPRVLHMFGSPFPNPWCTPLFCFMFDQVFPFLRQGLTLLAWNLLYTSGWPWTRGYPPAIFSKC